MPTMKKAAFVLTMMRCSFSQTVLRLHWEKCKRKNYESEKKLYWGVPIYIYIYFDLYDPTLSDVIISYDSRKGYPQADDQY